MENDENVTKLPHTSESETYTSNSVLVSHISVGVQINCSVCSKRKIPIQQCKKSVFKGKKDNMQCGENGV